MRIGLAPGGKVVMVLLGLGLIVLGLWYGGVLVLPSSGADRDAADLPDAEKRGEPAAREKEPRKPSREAGPPLGRSSDDVARPRPPPIFAETPRPLRVASTRGADRSPERDLRLLFAGEIDVVALDLQELVEHADRSRELVVIGASPGPVRPLHLCGAEGAVLAAQLRPGARVEVPRREDWLLVAHVAEARGIDSGELEFVSLAGESARETDSAMLLVEERKDGLDCLSLAEIGVQAPTLLMARERDARFFAATYRNYVGMASIDLDERGRRFVSLGDDEPGSYFAHASYLAHLRARAHDEAPIEPPPVARWILEDMR